MALRWPPKTLLETNLNLFITMKPIIRLLNSIIAKKK